LPPDGPDDSVGTKAQQEFSFVKYLSKTLRLVVTTCWVFALAMLPASAADAVSRDTDRAGLELFERKIRPVLVENCYQCHSAKAVAAGKLKGKLLLDSRAGIRRGGESGAVVIPGKADESLLLRALRHEGLKMPPNVRLPEETITAFEKWIELGAPDPRDGKASAPLEGTIDLAAGRTFWSFQRLQETGPPPVRNEAWARTAVDRFILARQERAGVTPAPMADRRTFIRRAYFDLIGLPPTPEQAAAFEADARPDACERLIDELLSSPHYGERWARHWLDLARFAESHGYAFDGDRPGAFHFRDFVLQALNEDLPYDEFVGLQIAGDLLKPGDYMGLAATGFLMAGPYTTQQTQKELERSRYEQLDDMISTLGTTMLGLTLGCARCHDHKYDPVPSHDYYRLVSTFAETGFDAIPVDLDPEVYEQAKAQFDVTHATLVDSRAQYEKTKLPARLEEWISAGESDVASPTFGAWHSVSPFRPQRGSGFAKTFDDAWNDVFPPEAEFLTKETIDLEREFEGRRWTEQPEWVDGKVHRSILSRKGKRAAYLHRTVEISSTMPWEVALGHDDGIKVWLNGEPIFANKERRDQPENFDKVTLPLRAGKNELLMKVVNDRDASNFYFKAAESSPPERITSLLAKEAAVRNEEESKELLEWFRNIDPGWRKLHGEVWRHEVRAPKPDFAKIFSARDGGRTYEFGDDTRKVYHLVRGNSDNKQHLAEPGFLQVLLSADKTGPRTTNDAAIDEPAVDKLGETAPRIVLARWLADTRHGAGTLLARVMVNRLWQHLFGRGIVSTPSDFGIQGERPTHPALLDYLAGELIRGGWRLKTIARLLLTSSVYRQAGGLGTAASQQRDPNNRLFWRHPSRRLEAEIIRDALLTVSGRLDRRMLGRGSLQEESPRRSIYLTVKRSELIPLLQLFDAPDAMQSIGERSTTTVSPQALTFMNSTFVRDIAGTLATRVLGTRGFATRRASIEGVVETAYQLALSRPPTSQERAQMVELIETHTKSYGDDERAPELATTDFCQVILCLNEFVYID
jgi:hypothetical protein